MTLSRINQAILLLVFVVFFLFYCKSYIVPLVIAILIWFTIRSVRQLISRSGFIKRKFPNWLLNIISLSILIVAFIGFSSLLTESVQTFSNHLTNYEKNILVLNQTVYQQFNFNFLAVLKSYFGEYDFTVVTQNAIRDISTFLGNSFIIFFYVLFILLEESIFMNKFKKLFKSTGDLQHTMQILDKIDHSFGRYLLLKTLVNFCSSLLCFVLLLFLKIDTPFLLALLIFIFSFIPTVGPILAVFFPSIIATLQYAEFSQGLMVMLAIGFVLLSVGNIIEPRVMGKSLNISPFFVIIALVFWGAIWGIIGMILSVPITAIMIIIFQQFESTKNISIILSETGELTDKIKE